MKRLALLLLAFAVLSSGAAYANKFLDGMVGSWEVTQNIVVTYRNQFVSEDTFTRQNTFKKLSDGTYYSVNFNDGTKVSESWYKRKGRVNRIIYTDDGQYSGEGKGVWSVRNGRLRITITTKTLEIKKGVSRMVTRRVDANTYADTATGTVTLFPYEDGPRNPTFRVRATTTSVRVVE